MINNSDYIRRSEQKNPAATPPGPILIPVVICAVILCFVGLRARMAFWATPKQVVMTNGASMPFIPDTVKPLPHAPDMSGAPSGNTPEETWVHSHPESTRANEASMVRLSLPVRRD